MVFSQHCFPFRTTLLFSRTDIFQCSFHVSNLIQTFQNDWVESSTQCSLVIQNSCSIYYPIFCQHHRGLPLKGFTHIQPDPHKNFQSHPHTTDSGIVPHQTAAQRHYLLDIIASVSLNTTNGIAKPTATNQSGNWYRCWKFLTNSDITDNLGGGLPQ